MQGEFVQLKRGSHAKPIQDDYVLTTRQSQISASLQDHVEAKKLLKISRVIRCILYHSAVHATIFVNRHAVIGVLC